MTGKRARVGAAVAGVAGLILGIVTMVVLQGQALAQQSANRRRVIRPEKARPSGEDDRVAEPRRRAVEFSYAAVTVTSAREPRGRHGDHCLAGCAAAARTSHPKRSGSEEAGSRGR